MVTKENFEEYALLYVDKELTKAEEKALLDFVALHPEFKAELQAYTATILIPDNNISFSNKEALLQEEPKTGIINLSSYKIYYAMAAGILALLFVLFLNKNTVETKTIAQNNTKLNTTKLSSPINTLNEVEKESTTKVIVARTKSTPQIHQQEEDLNNVHPLPSAKEVTIDEVPSRLNMVAHGIKGVEETDIAALDLKPIPATPSYTPTLIEATPGYFADNVAPLFALNESASGLTELSKVVTNKISDVRATAKQLKGSDVKIKIGNKEILIAKL
ncbi:MAG: hypothetical protein R2800_10645 [Flavipsychrobacter sp.]